MKSRKVRPLALFVLFSVQACADRQPQTSSETHFQKCMTHADCDPDEACLALLCRPIESESDGIAIQVNGQNLSLKVAPQVHLRYLTCDLFEGMDKQVGGEWVSLRNDLPVDRIINLLRSERIFDHFPDGGWSQGAEGWMICQICDSTSSTVSKRSP